MEQRKQALIDLFTKYKVLDDSNLSKIVTFASCQDLKILEKIFLESKTIRQNSVVEFKEILLKKPEVVETVEVIETSEQKEENLLKIKSLNFKDLIDETEELRKMEQSFTYKFIKVLQLYTFAKSYPKLLSREQFKNLPIKIPQDLKPDIDKLRQSIIKQGIGNSVINESLKKMDNTKNTSDIIISLQKIKEQIVTIDIDQLIVLINKNKKSQRDVEGKIGVVFIGVTGAGKSTTILGLLGHLMVEKKWQGQPWITPKYLKNIDGIQYLVATPSSKSVTRNVTAIQLPEDMFDGIPQQILFLDTPEFKDTQGSTVEISNTHGAAFAIKALRSARFVLVMNGQDQGSKNTGIVSMIEIINNLFPNYKQIKDSVVLFFNRFEQKDLTSMKNVILNVYNSLPVTKKDNPNVKLIFQDFIKKTQKREDIIVFDPLGKNQQYAKSFVHKILQMKQLESLEENFSVNYGDLARRDIEKQTTRLKDYCIQYFEQNNFVVCRYFLSQLAKFRKILGEKLAPEIIQYSFKAIQNKINQIISKKYTEIISSFNRAIKACVLMQQDVHKYFQAMKKLQDYEVLSEHITIQEFEKRMTENVDDNIRFVVQSLKNDPNIDDKTIKSLKILLKSFNKQQILKQIKRYYEQKIDQEFKKYQLFLKQGNFDQSIENYNRYNVLSKNIKFFCNSDDQSNAIVQPINNLIIKILDQKQSSISPLLQNFSDLESQKFQQIKKVSDYYIKLQSSSYEYLRTITNTKQVQTKLDAFSTMITNKAEDHWKKLEEYLGGRNNLTEQVVFKISKFYNQRNEMKQIPYLRTLMISKSNSVDKKIKTCLKLQGQVIERFIDQIQEKKIIDSVLKREIGKLDEAIIRIERVLHFTTEDEESILDKIQEKLFYFFSDITALIKENNYRKLDLTNDDIQDQIKKLGEVLEILLAFDLGYRNMHIMNEDKNQSQISVSLSIFNQKRSKLFQKEELVESFKQLKKEAEYIVGNNIESLTEIIKKINAGPSESNELNKKPKKIKLKEIESCLKFIEMGKKIFFSIPEKIKTFINVEEQFVTSIVNWYTKIVKQIKSDFEAITTITDLPKLKKVANQLRRNIQALIEITKYYPLLNKRLQQNQERFIQQEFSYIIADLIANFDAFVEKEEKRTNVTGQLRQFILKCRVLSTLDCFLQGKNYFQKLEKSVRQKINAIDKKIQSRFNMALSTKQYDDVEKYLKQMQKDKSSSFQESLEAVFNKLFQEVSQINKQKSRGFDSSQQMENLIEPLNSLITAKKTLQKQLMQKKTQFDRLNAKINQITLSLQNKIKADYQKSEQQIRQLIKRKNIEQAHIMLIRLQKMMNVLEGSETAKELSKKGTENLRAQIKTVLNNFRQRFVDKPQNITEKGSNFVSQYESLFQKSITYDALRLLKRSVDKVVEKIISEKIKQITINQTFTKQEHQRIFPFIQSIPKSFNSIKELSSTAKAQKQKFQEYKKEINQKSQKYPPFNQGGYINQKVVGCINDKHFSQTRKIELINRVKNVLDGKIIEFQTKGLITFLKQITQSQYFKHPYHPNDKTIKKIDPVPLVNEMYTQYYQKINKKITDLMNNQFNQIEKYVIDPSSEIEESKIAENHKRAVLQIIQFSQIIFCSSKDFFINAELLQEIIKLRYEQFLERLKKDYNLIKTKLNIQKSFQIQANDNQKNDQISNMNKLKIVQQFVLQYFAKIEELNQKKQQQNNLLEYITIEMKKIRQLFIFKALKQEFIQKIINVFDRYTKLSLRNDSFYRMDETEIKRQLQHKYSYFNYVSSFYPKLAKIFNISQNEVQTVLEKIRTVKTNLEKQSQDINKQINDFVQNPSFENNKLENIRRNVNILEQYSQYCSKLKNIKQIFAKNVKQKYLKMQKILNDRILEEQKKDINTQNKIEEQKTVILAQIKNQEEKLEEAFNKKITEMKQQHTRKLKDLSEQERYKLQKTHNGQVKSKQTLIKEEKEKLKKQKFLKLYRQIQKNEQQQKQFFRKLAIYYEKMVNVSMNLLIYKDYMESNKAIIDVLKRGGGKPWLIMFANALNDIGSGVSGTIISQNSDLKKLYDTNFKKNIQQLSLEDILDKLRDENKDIHQALVQSLEKKAKAFDVSYNKSLDEFQKDKKGQYKQSLISELKKGISNNASKDKILTTLSNIFSLWTILTSQEQDGSITYTYKPHTIQVLTTILLLGLTDIKQFEGYRNRFAEIKTGQGKSLILAVLCTVYALNGYDVDCVCYSENLSTRDSNSFKLLFTTLGIQNKIKYCTFTDLTESFIKNSQISLREQCKKLISNKSVSNEPMKTMNAFKIKDSKRILLMDQADVFFIDEFYGNTYSPSIELSSPYIKRLYALIWEKLEQNITNKNVIQQSTEFKNVITQFPMFENLIKNHLPHMISGAKNYKHDYQILNKKIAYKDQDGFSDKISYGYKTIFAYMYEFHRKTIEQLPPSLSSMDIVLCDISYSELPKMYDYIIGVTGTLKNLSQCKKDIMKTKYSILENYIIPSVYKSSKRFDAGYKIVSKENHHTEIIKNLKQHIDQKRPVMIFFYSLHEAIKFFQDPEYKPYRQDTVILNEKHDNQQRRIRINRAMSQGKISLITKSFARGIDFIIFERNVIQLGGVHLICAYVIEEKSEQTQILGRVGRQGDPASSVFIVSEQQLQNRLKIKHFDQRDIKKIQDTIDKARELKMAEKQLIINQTLLKCQQKHQQTLTLFANILNRQYKTALETIIELNRLPQLFSKKPVKTVIAFDATNSMESALAKTKIALSQSFTRIYKILKDNKVSSGFQIQIVAYRNYNLQEHQILISSGFQTTPDPLTKFLQGVEANGGWGNEALQLAYAHCLQVQELTQIIIITDAKPNTKNQTVIKRNDKTDGQGEQYWQKTKFKTPLDGQELFQKLKQKKVIVHSLPIGKKEVQEYYENLSKEGKGKCELFDPKSNNATSQLTDFISLSILNQLGGGSDLTQELAQSYRKAYKS